MMILPLADRSRISMEISDFTGRSKMILVRSLAGLGNNFKDNGNRSAGSLPDR
jgi:hypothetical protein